MDRAGVAGPRVHGGPQAAARPELAGARPSCRSTARWLAAEVREARGRHGDPSDGLTLGGGAARRASGGGERNSAAALGVRGARGEEVKRGERGGARWSWPGVWCSFYRSGGAGGGGSTGGRPAAINDARFSSKEKWRGGETGEPRRWRGGGVVSGAVEGRGRRAGGRR